jgi:hypothetical protein
LQQQAAAEGKVVLDFKARCPRGWEPKEFAKGMQAAVSARYDFGLLLLAGFDSVQVTIPRSFGRIKLQPETGIFFRIDEDSTYLKPNIEIDLIGIFQNMLHSRAKAKPSQ